jgi:flagellar protein FlgJ
MRVGLGSDGELNGHASSAVSPRLVRAAQEFEALMMKELLKPMTSQDALTGDGGDDGSTGALGEFASEALGQAISRNGGFGIAGRIVEDLSRTGHFSANGMNGGNMHADDAIRTVK